MWMGIDVDGLRLGLLGELVQSLRQCAPTAFWTRRRDAPDPQQRLVVCSREHEDVADADLIPSAAVGGGLVPFYAVALVGGVGRKWEEFVRRGRG